MNEQVKNYDYYYSDCHDHDHQDVSILATRKYLKQQLPCESNRIEPDQIRVRASQAACMTVESMQTSSRRS